MKKYVKSSKNINANTALDTIKNFDFVYEGEGFNLIANRAIGHAKGVVAGIEDRDSRVVNSNYDWFMTYSKELRKELDTLLDTLGENLATAVHEFNTEIAKEN